MRSHCQSCDWSHLECWGSVTGGSLGFTNFTANLQCTKCCVSGLHSGCHNQNPKPCPCQSEQRKKPEPLCKPNHQPATPSSAEKLRHVEAWVKASNPSSRLLWMWKVAVSPGEGIHKQQLRASHLSARVIPAADGGSREFWSTTAFSVPQVPTSSQVEEFCFFVSSALSQELTNK